MSGAATSFHLIPLDFAILAILPDEGTRLGLTELGKQVAAIKRELNAQLPEEAPKITSSQLSGRLRTLRLMGHAVTVVVQPVTNGVGWQRTRSGKALAEEATT